MTAITVKVGTVKQIFPIEEVHLRPIILARFPNIRLEDPVPHRHFHLLEHQFDRTLGFPNPPVIGKNDTDFRTELSKRLMKTADSISEAAQLRIWSHFR